MVSNLIWFFGGVIWTVVGILLFDSYRIERHCKKLMRELIDRTKN